MAQPPALPMSLYGDHVRVQIRVVPRGGRDAVDGLIDGADGPRLKLRVREAAENGKANATVIRLLAEVWGLPAARLRLVSGLSARNKSVAVTGEPEAVAHALRLWFEGQSFKGLPKGSP